MTQAPGATPPVPRARIAAGLWRTSPLGGKMFGTGFKMFVVLMVALLPLGVVAVIGTIQTIQASEIERIASLRFAAAQGANRLMGEISNDRATLRLVANSLEEDPRRTAICRRASHQLVAHGRPIAFAIFDGANRRLCQSGDVSWRDAGSGVTTFDQIATIDPAARHLVVRTNSANRELVAVVNYATDQLAEMTGVAEYAGGDLNISISRGAAVLPLAVRGAKPGMRVDRASAPLNVSDIDLNINVPRSPVTMLRLAATMLPLFMWFMAAGIGWWVVNRFLVKPLIDLNRQVAAYEPGTLLDPTPSAGQLANEIKMLGDTFRAISRDVAAHEAQLANALIHQQALTREVHHRVKNNLQIIASLINLHSRAASTPDAAAAYASIQRRVDALSVVHRNHYAAAELSHGIDAMALISELGSALRAGGFGGGSGFSIRVNVDHVYLSQDIAVPTAFLITELVELVILSSHPSPVTIALRRTDSEGMAELSITSDAFRSSPEVDRLLAERFGRVLTGLSRQLRATLSHDPVEGRYAIAIPVIVKA